jgi:hypothetical protein
MTRDFEAKLHLAKKGVSEAFLPSIDLSEAADKDAVVEIVDKFLTDHPEIVKGATPVEPTVPPANTGPAAGKAPPGSPEPEGPKTPEERHAVMAAHFRATQGSKAGPVGQPSG